ncbi:MAG: hypothetical protein ABRQ27_15830, partial [Clostridiaceae bacterium]
MENKVLAVVAGNEITEKDLNEAVLKYPENRRGMFSSEQGKKQLLEQMISFELFYNFGKESALDKTNEFEKELEKFKKELLTQMVVNKVMSEVTVIDDDALKFYEENKEMFSEPESVTAKHILVSSEEECIDIAVQSLGLNSISHFDPQKRIIEYMLKVPSHILCKLNEFRPLLRELGKDVLPDEIRLNYSKTDPVSWAYTRLLYRETAGLLLNEVKSWKENPALNFIDFDLLNRDTDVFESSRVTGEDVALWKSIVTIKFLHEFTRTFRD